MSRRGFDRIMVATSIGSNRKLGRLNAAERWVYVAGVLALAGESPQRGLLLLAEGVPATEVDVARHAGVPPGVARSAIKQLRELRMLYVDDDSGCEAVHDWHEWQKEPKPSDLPAATRKRKRDERARKRSEVTRDSGVTSASGHAVSRHEVEDEGEGEVEGEEADAYASLQDVAPSEAGPQFAGGGRRASDPHRLSRQDWSAAVSSPARRFR